jgi:hypothetical protein
MGWYRVRKDGKLFISRFRWIQTPWFAIYTTRIHGADTDRDPHDHSRPFVSLILTGGYDERVVTGSDAFTRSHGRGSVHLMPLRWAHQITSVRGPLRTLVICGPRAETWSFWTENGKVDWRDDARAAAD